MATKKRRLNGDGSFKKRSNGTWEYQFVVPGKYDKNGRAIRISTYGRTQAECREKAKARLNQYATGTVYAKDDITIVELAKKICKDKFNDGTTQEQSYARDLETVKRLDPLGNIPIQKISVAQLRDFCNAQRKYSDSVINKIYQMLKRVFLEAVKLDIITKDLMIEVKRPKSLQPKKKVRALTVPEEVRVLEAIEKREVKYTDAMLTMLFTGLRMGEILALQVCDIDYDAKVIRVSKTISRVGSGAPFVNDKTKTDAGIRNTRMSDDLCAFMHTLTDGKKPKDYLFTDDNGRLVSTSTVYSHYIKIRDSVVTDINGTKVTLHSLRHTFATRCIESGMSDIVLQHKIGHQSVATTKDIYGDVFAQYMDAKTTAAEDYMKSVGVQLRYGDGENDDESP